MATLARFLKAFRRDRRGVSAVEFALIAPVLITTYMGLAELSQGMTAHRRVSHAASAIGDLVAQTNEISNSGMTDVFSAASNIVTPFSLAPLEMRVTSVTGNAQGKPIIDWSDAPTGQSVLTPLKKDDEIPVCSTSSTKDCIASGLITAAGETVIISEATYTYETLLEYVIKNGLVFNEKFYLRPRQGGTVNRTT